MAARALPSDWSDSLIAVRAGLSENNTSQKILGSRSGPLTKAVHSRVVQRQSDRDLTPHKSLKSSSRRSVRNFIQFASVNLNRDSIILFFFRLMMKRKRSGEKIESDTKVLGCRKNLRSSKRLNATEQSSKNDNLNVNVNSLPQEKNSEKQSLPVSLPIEM